MMLDDLWPVLRYGSITLSGVAMFYLAGLWALHVDRSPWMPVVGAYAFATFAASIEFALRNDPGSIRVVPLFAASLLAVVIAALVHRSARQARRHRAGA